jgi:uncharacterized membrane protein YhaH (DUF805 family)
MDCNITEWVKTLVISFVAVSMILYLLEPDMIMKIDLNGDIVICYRKLVSVAMMISIIITVTSICIEGTDLQNKKASDNTVKSNSKMPSVMSSKIKTY